MLLVRQQHQHSIEAGTCAAFVNVTRTTLTQALTNCPNTIFPWAQCGGLSNCPIYLNGTCEDSAWNQSCCPPANGFQQVQLHGHQTRQGLQSCGSCCPAACPGAVESWLSSCVHSRCSTLLCERELHSLAYSPVTCTAMLPGPDVLDTHCCHRHVPRSIPTTGSAYQARPFRQPRQPRGHPYPTSSPLPPPRTSPCPTLGPGPRMQRAHHRHQLQRLSPLTRHPCLHLHLQLHLYLQLRLNLHLHLPLHPPQHAAGFCRQAPLCAALLPHP